MNFFSRFLGRLRHSITPRMHSAAHYALNGGAILYGAAHAISASGVPLPPKVTAAAALIVGLGNIYLHATKPATQDGADAAPSEKQ